MLANGTKMKFGAHQTFALREGWLHKGVRLLESGQVNFESDDAQNKLGVGRNMVKSIKFWMQLTGLIEKNTQTGNVELSPLAQLISQHDPYFIENETWWALHVNMTTHKESPWCWFFENFRGDKFDRAQCIEQLNRFVRVGNKRPPQIKTIQREVACLLQTYGQSIPAERTDPEDGNDCPFIRLNLLQHFKESGAFRFQKNTSFPTAKEILCYALAKQFNNGFDIRLQEAVAATCSLFKIDEDVLVITIEEAIAEFGSEKINLINQAGERLITMDFDLCWLKTFYLNSNRTRNAA